VPSLNLVGAGSTGYVLANRLSQDSWRQVLLIEAGSDYPDINLMPPDIVRGLSVAASHDWGFVSEPGVLDRPIDLLRGKLTGGSSAVNVTLAVRGWPDDYDCCHPKSGSWCKEISPRIGFYVFTKVK